MTEPTTFRMPNTAFRMPPLPQQWRGPDGAEIAFGERWGMNSPPEDAYSRVTQPERYAPLHDVADALAAHLTAEYDCVAEEDEPAERELRAVRLRSALGTAAVRIAWTDFPGVQARLGNGATAAAPRCGCDACDERLEEAADALKDAVLGTVRGELRESYSPERGTESANLGYSRGWGPSARSREELQSLADATPVRWAAWPLRST